MVTNGDIRQRVANGKLPKTTEGTQAGRNDVALKNEETPSTDSTLNLLICVGGIYASLYARSSITTAANQSLANYPSSSLTWGVLQERITTTNYGSPDSPEIFKYPVVVNTVQSAFAALLGYLYVLSTRKAATDLPVFPSARIIWPLTLVALTSSLSSPFGYASLAHVDYITFILAKSCKLLPVMLLHVTLYRKKYPFYKYAVVGLVTAGVAIFTLHQPASSKKKASVQSGNSTYGLLLLGINLLFDGLTNSTQDDIYASFRPYSGQQMMCALNIISTAITSTYLMLSPFIAQTGIGHYVGMDLAKSAGELNDAMAFVQKHPSVGWDILAFAACGAVGQLFICKLPTPLFASHLPLPTMRSDSLPSQSTRSQSSAACCS